MYVDEHNPSRFFNLCIQKKKKNIANSSIIFNVVYYECFLLGHSRGIKVNAHVNPQHPTATQTFIIFYLLRTIAELVCRKNNLC